MALEKYDIVNVIAGTYAGHTGVYLGIAGKISADVRIEGTVRTIRLKLIKKKEDAHADDLITIKRKQYESILERVKSLELELELLNIKK